MVDGPVDIVLHVFSPEARKRAAEMRERASGILRIFGVPPGTDVTTPAAQLTGREQEVADLVAHGLSNAAVARRLYLSPATVATHVSHILRKLDVHTRTDIARESALRTLAPRLMNVINVVDVTHAVNVIHASC